MIIEINDTSNQKYCNRKQTFTTQFVVIPK